MPIYTNTKNITNSKSGTPTITFNSKLNGITDYSVYGNGVQNGTPSPTNIVNFDGCGDKTPNLVNVSTSNLLTYDSSYNNFTINNTNATITTSGNALFGFIVEVNSDTQYTVKADSVKYGLTRIREYSSKPTTWSGSNFIQQSVNAQTGYSYSFTTTPSTKFICVTFYFDSSSSGAVISNIMLNTGSSILPYERYGYRLDISCNNTTSIYFGQTQTVRRIKKVVLDGSETLYFYENNGYVVINDGLQQTIAPYCDILPGTILPISEAPDSVKQLKMDIENINCAILFKVSPGFLNVDDFRAWLKENTPTVWYVLATPEIGIVNEPLMKIKDYADELTFTNSQIQIPTIEGINTLSINTTLPPSNIEISYTLPDYSKITKIYRQDGLEIKHIIDNNNNFIFKSKSYYG